VAPGRRTATGAKKARVGAGSGKKVPANSRFAPYSKVVPEHGHTTDRIEQILREAILDGLLAPGSWLRESELARELAVSRTPVREALRRLAVEGLVTITAHQGAVVASMTIEDILEVYVVRENLEGLAARLAARHRTQPQLERMDSLLSEMEQAASGEVDPAMLARLNLAFHEVIREASNNQYLTHFLKQVEHSVRRFRRTTYEVPGRGIEAAEEHRRVLEAIESGDAADAQARMVEHMRHARELRIRMLAES
jgi:DNA-binding GntR family transcriptional regulator